MKQLWMINQTKPNQTQNTTHQRQQQQQSHLSSQPRLHLPKPLLPQLLLVLLSKVLVGAVGAAGRELPAQRGSLLGFGFGLRGFGVWWGWASAVDGDGWCACAGTEGFNGLYFDADPMSHLITISDHEIRDHEIRSPTSCGTSSDM